MNVCVLVFNAVYINISNILISLHLVVEDKQTKYNNNIKNQCQGSGLVGKREWPRPRNT